MMFVKPAAMNAVPMASAVPTTVTSRPTLR